MRLLSFLVCVLCAYSLCFAQNLDYNARISSFSAGDCGFDGGFNFEREHTWKGWLWDNANPMQTFSGCIERGTSSSTTTVNGSFANRSATNSRATTLIARLDAWEDDHGDRCNYDNDDDCRVYTTTNIPLGNPLEYAFQSSQTTCGTDDYRMEVNCSYRYFTVSLDEAVDDNSRYYSGGGDRNFWGASGSWASDFNDCAASGTINHGETSSMTVTVSCMQTINFFWRVSSEENGDYLEVLLNGQLDERISGNTGWISKQINLAYGENTITWRYVKNGSVSLGLDRGFVDRITYTPATDLDPGSISGDQMICYATQPTTLTSVAPAEGYGSQIFYQWQRSTNGSSGWYYTGGSAETYSPGNLYATTYYRRRAYDNCGEEAFSNVIAVHLNEAPYGSLSGDATICEGSTANLVFTATSGTGPFDLVINGVNYLNISSGENIPVSPTSSTSYDLSSVTDANHCNRSGAFPGGADVVVETFSTAPTVHTPTDLQCPGSTISLSASGGTAGSGSDIYWYDNPPASGNLLGTGSTLDVSPTISSTYYARREGNCNVTDAHFDTVNVRRTVYSEEASALASDYCTDDDGWHHFYGNDDQIIFSLQGDLSGATSNPVITLSNNGNSFQSTISGDGICDNNTDAGIERFELGRSWNVDFSGTLNPPYAIRHYFPSSEKTALEAQAAQYIDDHSDCNYSYRYTDEATGFYWFKNATGTYSAPYQEESPTLLPGSMGAINGMEYTEVYDINSFSGGAGAIDLQSAVILPVELIFFTGWVSPHAHTLKWETTAEYNNDYFEVERSTDPSQGFQAIAQVHGAGQAHVYHFVDEKPLSGDNYYRLRQVDIDGTSSYSNWLKLHQATQVSHWQLAPNPTSGFLSCQFYLQTPDLVEIHLYDRLGQRLSRQAYDGQTGANELHFDLRDKPAGMYFIVLQDANGQLLYQDKLLKH